MRLRQAHFLQHQRKGDLLFKRRSKRRQARKQGTAGAKAEARASPIYSRGEGGHKTGWNGGGGYPEQQEPGRWEKQAGSAGPKRRVGPRRELSNYLCAGWKDKQMDNWWVKYRILWAAHQTVTTWSQLTPAPLCATDMLDSHQVHRALCDPLPWRLWLPLRGVPGLPVPLCLAQAPSSFRTECGHYSLCQVVPATVSAPPRGGHFSLASPAPDTGTCSITIRGTYGFLYYLTNTHIALTTCWVLS